MKNFLAILLSVLMILSVFVSCGKKPAVEQSVETSSTSVSEKTSEKATTKSDLKGEITYMVLNSFANNPTDALYDAAKKFESLHSDVKVTIEPVAAVNLYSKFTSSTLAGAGPDLVSLDTGGMIVDTAAIGLLAPLNDKLAPIKDDFQIGALEAGKYKGKYYAVPWYINNVGLYYNKTMLNKVGIKNPPATWDEFKTAIAAVTSNGYKALAININAAYFMYPFFFQNENVVIDTSGAKPFSVVNTKSGKEAFEFFCQIHTKYNGFPESTKDALSWDQVYAPFIQGDVAFLMAGDWANGIIESAKPAFEYAIAPMPAGKKAATVMGGYSISIRKNTKNFEESWAFAEFLTAKEQNNVLLYYSRITARKDIDQAALIAAKPILEPFIKQTKDSYARPSIKFLGEADQILSDAFQRVYLGEKDVDAALAEYEKKIDVFFDEKYK
jgi:multiple sugar transport system substrate-binding protein